MRACERCGKNFQTGNIVSHSNRKIKRKSFPNIHYARIKISSAHKRMRLCTKCLRIVKGASGKKKDQKTKEKIIETPQTLQIPA
ncbi:MAG: 50S ribosomal protein L28 [Candidatus Woykebacteria bacterium RBG_13_40_7b]|uniref:Large ribosomal subunit protein bL28 n=1 Tax=Candidatus Woykebacteria bacterium RBG_13_40_7b TaxID=1802594 RepID=A0A1G1WB35_9BACT|nr:MAG: 50S ribosomal protein L28 [Candidatus Woykebacteria bacterium RBG_13_40_7b]